MIRIKTFQKVLFVTVLFRFFRNLLTCYFFKAKVGQSSKNNCFIPDQSAHKDNMFSNQLQNSGTMYKKSRHCTRL